jgi:hypothetical protein
MDDPVAMLVSMLVSTVGFAIFWYGKKQRRIPQLALGLLMTVVPYFLPSALLSALSGVAIGGLLFVLVKAGL